MCFAFAGSSPEKRHFDFPSQISTCLTAMKRKVESTEPATGGKPRCGIAPNVVTENAASVPKLFTKWLDGLRCGSRSFFLDA